jgi:hypothetical protein
MRGVRCVYGIRDDCTAVEFVKPALDRSLENMDVYMFRLSVEMLMKLCEACPYKSKLLGGDNAGIQVR